MNIAIVEPLFHWTYFMTMVEIFKEENDLTLVISRSVYDRLANHYGFDFDAFDSYVMDDFQIKKAHDYLASKSIDYIFYNTIAGYKLAFDLYRYPPNSPYYLTCHNFHIKLGNKPYPFETPEKFKLHRDVNDTYRYFCSKIFERAKSILSIDLNVKDYMSQVIKHPPVHFFPWAVATGEISPLPNSLDTGPTVFSIPGTIEDFRRDYFDVLRAFDKLSEQFQNVELVLLGAPSKNGNYGELILDYSRKINEKHNRTVIRFFDAFVPEEVFRKTMAASDYILLPVSTKEPYGTYKGSGTLYDSLTCGRPVLLPKTLHLSRGFIQTFNRGVLVYKNLEQAVPFLLSLPEKAKEELKEGAAENARFLHINSQAKRINQILFGSHRR